jgi:hypothetical protein
MKINIRLIYIVLDLGTHVDTGTHSTHCWLLVIGQLYFFCVQLEYLYFFYNK